MSAAVKNMSVKGILPVWTPMALTSASVNWVSFAMGHIVLVRASASINRISFTVDPIVLLRVVTEHSITFACVKQTRDLWKPLVIPPLSQGSKAFFTRPVSWNTLHGQYWNAYLSHNSGQKHCVELVGGFNKFLFVFANFFSLFKMATM